MLGIRDYGDRGVVEYVLHELTGLLFCDTHAAAGSVSPEFFNRENVHSPNVSAGRTKQAFVLLSQKVLENLETALKSR